MLLAFQAVTWSPVQMCGCISGMGPAKSFSTSFGLEAPSCDSDSSSWLQKPRVNLWWNNSHTGGAKVNRNTHRNLEKQRGRGRGCRGKSANSEVYWSAPHSPESETSKCVVVWKLPFFFFSPTGNSLPKDKPAWSFPQEISKCLCLERQVAGTHSKASSASRTTENRASPSEKFLEAQAFTTEGQGWAARGQPPAWWVSASDLWGD